MLMYVCNHFCSGLRPAIVVVVVVGGGSGSIGFALARHIGTLGKIGRKDVFDFVRPVAPSPGSLLRQRSNSGSRQQHSLHVLIIVISVLVRVCARARLHLRTQSERCGFCFKLYHSSMSSQGVPGKSHHHQQHCCCSRHLATHWTGAAIAGTEVREACRLCRKRLTELNGSWK